LTKIRGTGTDLKKKKEYSKSGKRFDKEGFLAGSHVTEGPPDLAT